jgi:hypothetical protein
MPARVQEVQPTDCHGRLGYSFSIWDEKRKLALTIGFATDEEAQQARDEIKAIVARAILVTSPP